MEYSLEPEAGQGYTFSYSTNHIHIIYMHVMNRKQGRVFNICPGSRFTVVPLLKLAQLRWTDHVTRMPDERLPKKILYAELQVGKRSHGGQKKRYKDTLKASLKDFNIPTESWEWIAQDRTKWRGLIRRGSW